MHPYKNYTLKTTMGDWEIKNSLKPLFIICYKQFVVLKNISKAMFGYSLFWCCIGNVVGHVRFFGGRFGWWIVGSKVFVHFLGRFVNIPKHFKYQCKGYLGTNFCWSVWKYAIGGNYSQHIFQLKIRPKNFPFEF